MPIVPEAFIPTIEQAVVELKQFRACDETPSPLISIIEDLEVALASVAGHHDVSDLYEDDNG